MLCHCVLMISVLGDETDIGFLLVAAIAQQSLRRDISSLNSEKVSLPGISSNQNPSSTSKVSLVLVVRL
jgi:hypothetical protein